MRRAYFTSPSERRYAKKRRDYLRAVRLCLNGPADADRAIGRHGKEHGPVVGDSGRCQNCIDARRRADRPSSNNL